MAKRWKEPGEEVATDFQIPKFDEEAFLKRERRNIKTTIISFLFGCLIALVCFGFWALMGTGVSIRWELVLLLGVINAAFIKYLFLRLNIDLAEFGRKGWFGSYVTYFFTWLIVLIILVNPPFYDGEVPRVEVAVLPDMQELGGTVKIVAKITDNAGLKKDDIQFDLTDPAGSTIAPDFSYESEIFRYTQESPDSLNTDKETYSFKLTVTDSAGHIKVHEGSFSYSNNTIYLALPDNGDSVRAASDIKFGIDATVSRAYYTFEDGTSVNTTKPSQSQYYVTYPEYEGWMEKQNVTIKVSAYVVYYFENKAEDFNNTIVDTDSYTFYVEEDNKVGTKASEKIELPQPHYVLAPGFELIIFIVSLIAVILIFKHKKKNRQQK